MTILVLLLAAALALASGAVSSNASPTGSAQLDDVGGGTPTAAVRAYDVGGGSPTGSSHS